MNDRETATDRQGFGIYFVVGLFLLVTPLAPVGIAVCVFCGIIMLFSGPVRDQEHRMMREAEETGGGFGSFLLAALMILLLGAVAAVVAFGAMAMAMGG